MRKFFNDEVGFVISAELVLVMTIAVLAMVVGLSSVRDAINAELVDISNAFGAIDQSYYSLGSYKPRGEGKSHAFAAGFGFQDREDDCDSSRCSSKKSVARFRATVATAKTAATRNLWVRRDSDVDNEV